MTGAASNQMDVERDELPPLAPSGRHARRTGPSQLTWGSLTEPTVPPSSTSAVIATACVRRRSDSLCCDHAELDHGPCSLQLPACASANSRRFLCEAMVECYSMFLLSPNGRSGELAVFKQVETYGSRQAGKGASCLFAPRT
jgi:hypothetical protein